MDLADNDRLLKAFVSGRLSEGANEAIMAQLELDDAALARVDELWQDLHGEEPAWKPLELTTTRAAGIERRLFRRLHRSNMSGTALRLSTTGIGAVFLALIRPLFAFGRRKETEED